MAMTRPPPRGNRLVEAVALSIVLEIFFVLMVTIINAKVKTTRHKDRRAVVAFEPFNRRAIDAEKCECIE